jgi:hypothetical protein
MEDNHKIAIEFLLWSYFKLTTKDSKEEIVEKCISRAYSDATNQGAYNAIRDKETDSGASYHEELKEHILSSAIEDFEEWHKEICREMTECYKNVKMKSSQDGSAFTYGNAQKWLNMTIKYLFIVNLAMEMLGAAEDFRDFYRRKFKDFEGYFHVPIYRYIIESLWKKEDTVEDTSKWLCLKEKTRKDGTLGAYSADKHKVWSQFNEVDYQKVKKHIDDKISEEGVSPMRWENEKWIGVANRREEEKQEKRKKMKLEIYYGKDEAFKEGFGDALWYRSCDFTRVDEETRLRLGGESKIILFTLSRFVSEVIAKGATGEGIRVCLDDFLQRVDEGENVSEILAPLFDMCEKIYYFSESKNNIERPVSSVSDN